MFCSTSSSQTIALNEGNSHERRLLSLRSRAASAVSSEAARTCKVEEVFGSGSVLSSAAFLQGVSVMIQVGLEAKHGPTGQGGLADSGSLTEGVVEECSVLSFLRLREYISKSLRSAPTDTYTSLV